MGRDSDAEMQMTPQQSFDERVVVIKVGEKRGGGGGAYEEHAAAAAAAADYASGTSEGGTWWGSAQGPGSPETMARHEQDFATSYKEQHHATSYDEDDDGGQGRDIYSGEDRVANSLLNETPH